MGRPQSVKRQRVALIGNLCDCAVIFGQLLSSEDLEVSIYVSRKELQDSMSSALRGDKSEELEERIRRLRTHNPQATIWDHAPRLEWMKVLPLGARIVQAITFVRLLRELRKADVIVSFAMYHIVSMFSGRPYLAFSTGADLHEIAMESTTRGWLMRRAFHRASSVHASYDPVSRENATKLKLQISAPFLIPWEIPAQPAPFGDREGPINVFMPSRQDWGEPGSSQLAKGNDRFIRAWARRVKEGWASSMIIVEYGGHVQATKDLVEELGVAEHVRYVPRLNQPNLQRFIEEADLVADQFDQGTPGILALQSMASGRAVSIYWDEFSSLFAYSEIPPVLNGNSEEALYAALKACASRQDLQARGRAGYEWMTREYGRRKLREQLRLSVSMVTGVPLGQ